MNYENNNQNGIPGTSPEQQPGINNMYQGNNMNYDPNQVNQMNSMNQMNTIAPGMGNLNNTDYLNPKPKKNIIPIIIVVVAVVALLGGLITYKTIISSPKMVFKTAVKNAYKGMSNTLNEVDQIVEKFDFENKALTFNLSTGIDSNIISEEELGFKLSDIKVTGELGLDANKKEALVKASYKGEKEEVNFQEYYTNKKVYVGSNLLDSLVYLEGEDLDIDFDSIENAIKEIEEAMPDIEDVDYLIGALTDAIADSLDNDYMDKEQTKIDVTKDNQNFTKYSYKITDKSLRSLMEDVIAKLEDDKKFIEIIAEIEDMEEDEVKEELSKMKDEAKEIEYDDKIVLNVYTQGFLSTFAGFSIEVENDEVFTYVDDGKTFIITIVEGDEKVEIKGEKGKETVITGEADDEKILEIKIKSFDREKIDLSLNIYEDGKNLVGVALYLSCKEEKATMSGDYKIRVEYKEEFVEVSGDYKIEAKDSLEMPDIKKAVNADTIDENEIIDRLEEKAKNDVLLNTIFGDTIEEARKEALGLDYNGMKALYNMTELKEVLAESGDKVIFVGSTYYSSYSEADASKLFDSLIDAQERENFYSYRISELYETDVKALFPDVVPICKPGENATCEETPIIYFIKDGKAYGALTGAVTVSDIKTELQKIRANAPVL